MIIYFPHTAGSGGPGSFQVRFEDGLKKRGWTIGYAGDTNDPDIVLVVGGTRKLFWLLKMKLKGVPILYRLDGINWLHKKTKVGVKKYFVTEIRNWTNKFIHAFLADKIVYQSKFVETWWSKSGWKERENTSIIYNGVDIPDNIGKSGSKFDKRRLVILEGTIDYSPYAVKLINELAHSLLQDVTIELYGKFENKKNQQRIDERVQYKGFLERDKVFSVLHNSVYLSLDINPACPNTVIEAMASGAPVAAFDTGALPELVKNGAGEIVPYGSDPWKLGYPNVKELVNKIEDIFSNYQTYSGNAKNLATDKFSLEKMFESYMAEIKSLTK
jgi:glycosyltransferase involved in cell wall biosynthesis